MIVLAEITAEARYARNIYFVLSNYLLNMTYPNNISNTLSVKVFHSLHYYKCIATCFLQVATVSCGDTGSPTGRLIQEIRTR